MKRITGLLLFSAVSITGAYAQSQSPSQTPQSAAASITAAAGIAEGDYAGTVQEQGGKRTSNLKMTIRDVTTDGRVTATVEATHPRAACAKRLPMNGIVKGTTAITPANIAGIVAGTSRIYIYGQVFYGDGFAAEERVTEFCAFVSADRLTLQKLTRNYRPEDLKVNFVAAPEGNHAT